MLNHKKSLQVAIASVVLIAAGAHAALPPSVSGLGTTLTDYVNDTFTMIIPVVALSIGLGLLIKIVKRLSSKV